MKLTQRKPELIFANVETALKPRMRSLQDMGFSDTEIVQLVSSCPTMLLLRDIQPRISFWRSLLGSNERLIKACRRDMFLLTSSLPQKIEPNISLLRECGISEQGIALMVVTLPSFLRRTEKCIKEFIEHVEELGVSRDCKMFPRALLAVMNLSRSRFDATFATLMSFGWSQPDCIAAFRRQPTIWNYSKKNLSDKMTFLMKEAGCEPTYIIGHPVLLTLSLEKRLRPRYEVMNFLDQNKLLDKGRNLLSVMVLSEEKFRNKFLFLLRKEKFIAQYDSYVDAVQGKHLVVEKLVWRKVNYFRKESQKISSSLPIATNLPRLRRFPWRKAASAAASSSVEPLSLRRFPRITVDAAASSPSANGDSARYLSLTPHPPPVPPSPSHNPFPSLFPRSSQPTAAPFSSLPPFPNPSFFPFRESSPASPTPSPDSSDPNSPLSGLDSPLSVILFRPRQPPSSSSTPLFALSNTSSPPLSYSLIVSRYPPNKRFLFKHTRKFQHKTPTDTKDSTHPKSGWSDAQVMKLMQRAPSFLHANIETFLKPRMRSLQDMGFSDTEIVQLVSSCPNMLNLRDIQLRINFWRSLLGSNERLLKACRRNMFLLTCSLARKIEPNISLLRECGISEQCIVQMVVTLPSLFCQTEKCIKEAIEHVEELGVSRDCKMFPQALLTVVSHSRSRFDATFATLMSFGWSQPDSIAAFRRLIAEAIEVTERPISGPAVRVQQAAAHAPA
ncbi:hypothetical protein C4D60_Mb10t00960 [Musa balbisiana]|uniref:Uncharacterized protein n=1 Tax=Musa balbisiana TaxID=52838 RepID=A0A4S8ITR8_MUSBA|nr:hypothetical protein C4D60_Mb10t00960 [Musa balbisiana]